MRDKSAWETAFEGWWSATMDNRMRKSKYLAKKAWLAALRTHEGV